MALYLVTLLASTVAATRKDGVDSVIVSAADATQAKEIAAANYDGDGAIWSSATTTELAAPSIDWEGWTFKATIYTATPKVFTYVGTSDNDTIDEIGAALVTLLNADDDIANASYAANVLTLAGAADGLGDMAVAFEITPPSKYSAIPSLVGTIVDEGASGDALTVALPGDADVQPVVLAALKSY